MATSKPQPMLRIRVFFLGTILVMPMLITRSVPSSLWLLQVLSVYVGVLGPDSELPGKME